MSHRVMEVYLQEIVIATHTNDMTSKTKHQIEALLNAYPQILQRSVFLLKSFVQPNAWPCLW